jgi:hypothetical protein
LVINFLFLIPNFSGLLRFARNDAHHAVIPSGAKRSRGIYCNTPLSNPNCLRFGADSSAPHARSSRAPVGMTGQLKMAGAPAPLFIIHYSLEYATTPEDAAGSSLPL